MTRAEAPPTSHRRAHPNERIRRIVTQIGTRLNRSRIPENEVSAELILA